MKNLWTRFLLYSKIYFYWFTVQQYDFQFRSQMLHFLFRLRSHRMSFSLILYFKMFYLHFVIGWRCRPIRKRVQIIILKTSLMEDLTWTSFEYRKFLFLLFLEHRRWCKWLKWSKNHQKWKMCILQWRYQELDKWNQSMHLSTSSLMQQLPLRLV